MSDLKIQLHCDECGVGVDVSPRGSRIESVSGVVTWIAFCPQNGSNHEVTVRMIDGFDVPGGQSAIDYLKEAGAIDLLGEVATV